MTTSTFLPLFTGFYESIWDNQDFDGEDEYFDLPEDKTFDEFVDWAAYHERIAKEMCSALEGDLCEFVSSIEFERISSPKYYNFETDAIYCEITFDETLVDAYLTEHKDKFAEFLVERYTSRDGFVSFFSTDVEPWMDGYKTDSHMLGSVLEFICKNEEIEEPYDLADCYISNFYTDEIRQYERESN
jgi:hypothetical protein